MSQISRLLIRLQPWFLGKVPDNMTQILVLPTIRSRYLSQRKHSWIWTKGMMIGVSSEAMALCNYVYCQLLCQSIVGKANKLMEPSHECTSKTISEPEDCSPGRDPALPHTRLWVPAPHQKGTSEITLGKLHGWCNSAVVSFHLLWSLHRRNEKDFESWRSFKYTWDPKFILTLYLRIFHDYYYVVIMRLDHSESTFSDRRETER